MSRAYLPICARCGCTLNVAPCLRCSLNGCRHVDKPIPDAPSRREPTPAGPARFEPTIRVSDLIGLAGLLLVAASGAALLHGVA